MDVSLVTFLIQCHIKNTELEKYSDYYGGEDPMIAILIISASSKRWDIEKKVWKKYANTYPNIKCFFII